MTSARSFLLRRARGAGFHVVDGCRQKKRECDRIPRPGPSGPRAFSVAPRMASAWTSLIGTAVLAGQARAVLELQARVDRVAPQAPRLEPHAPEAASRVDHLCDPGRGDRPPDSVAQSRSVSRKDDWPQAPRGPQGVRAPSAACPAGLLHLDCGVVHSECAGGVRRSITGPKTCGFMSSSRTRASGSGPRPPRALPRRRRDGTRSACAGCRGRPRRCPPVDLHRRRGEPRPRTPRRAARRSGVTSSASVPLE